MKKGIYYIKDKKAKIYKLVGSGGVGGVGEDDVYYQAISASPLWCYTKQLSGNLVYEAMVAGSDETRLFIFDYNTQIKPQGKIKYGDNWYEITRVDRTDDYKTECYVYVRDSTKPYRPRDVNGRVEGSGSGSGGGVGL